MAAGVGGEAALAEVALKGTAAIIAVLRRLSKRRLAAMRTRMLAAANPIGDVDAALAEEARRERTYQQLADRRVRAGMRIAVRASDVSTRAAAIDKLIRREQIIAGQRAVAAAERVLASAELQELRRTSPQGAYWLLGPRRTHTPDCIAMANHFWPWKVLDEVHPLLHVGCGCYLRSLGWAIANGFMTAADIPSPRQAMEMAAPIIAHVRAEKADAAKRYEQLEEAATLEVTIRERLTGAVPDDDLAILPLRADEGLAGFNPDAVEHPLAEALLLEAETEHKGAMVCFYPDAKLAKKLAITGGSPPEQLHVTLAFLGPDASKLDFDQAKAAVAHWAAKTPKQSGELSGIGHFDVGGGDKVTYRSVDLPGLAPRREDLVKALARAKTPAATNHGFTAHMTIDDKLRRNVEVAKVPIAFDTVTLKWGEERHHFALAGT